MKLNQPYNIELRDTLRLRRYELGLTQEQVAEKIGITAMYISHLEIGRRDIKLILLEKWANALNLDLQIDIKKNV